MVEVGVPVFVNVKVFTGGVFVFVGVLVLVEVWVGTAVKVLVRV